MLLLIIMGDRSCDLLLLFIVKENEIENIYNPIRKFSQELSK